MQVRQQLLHLVALECAAPVDVEALKPRIDLELLLLDALLPLAVPHRGAAAAAAVGGFRHLGLASTSDDGPSKVRVDVIFEHVSLEVSMWGHTSAHGL